MPERLRRLDETFHQFPIYFVTTCTYKRVAILNDSEIHKQLIEFGQSGEHHGAWLGAYILMPDHLLRSNDSYSEKWEYVRENPVRAGLAHKWIDWPFIGEVFDLEFPRERT